MGVAKRAADKRSQGLRNAILVVVAIGGVVGVAIASGRGSATTPSADPARQKPAAQQEASGPLEPDGERAIRGTVAETMNSGGYTYVRLTAGGAEAWAAVPEVAVNVGQEVTITGTQPMHGFSSPTLKRQFDVLYFGESLEGSGMPAGHPKQPSIPAAPALGSAEVENISVPKAEGPDGRTVAEVWAQKADLSGKQVVVRGKVVKANSGIMSKNWMHLRDGTGTAEQKDNDITVTSTEAAAAVGDVVTVTGVVGIDRDFGANYKYPVIIEDAKVAK